MTHLAVLILFPLLAQAPDAAHPTVAINVFDFGAKGDGVTDDTGAFQKALDTAGETGAIVSVPAGQFLIKGHLNVPEEVAIEGTWKTPARGPVGKGSTLLAVEGQGNADGTPFITLNQDSVLRGLVIHYPEQIDENPPHAYPWTVRGNGDNCTITDVLMTNPYQAVDFGTNPCGRHFIDNLYAQALYRGILVDKCFDVGRIQNVHLWPFWKISDKLSAFSKEKGIAFTFARTDWEMVTNCFCISYNVGFLFKEFGDGPGNVMVTQSGSDIGPCAVRVEGSQGHAGHTFANCQFMTGIEVLPTNTGPIKFTACGFWPIDGTASHARLGGKGHVFFEACHFSAWDLEDKGAACIEAACEGLTINGCDFMAGGKKQVRLDEGVQAAIITANRLRGGESIDNRCSGDVQIGLNATR